MKARTKEGCGFRVEVPDYSHQTVRKGQMINNSQHGRPANKEGDEKSYKKLYQKLKK